MYIALYARQSIDKENSVSIETQLEYCRSTLPPDERSLTIRTFADKGYSGKDTNRPEFQKLMQEIRRGRVQKIVVYKFDRVSRSIIDFSDMLQTFKEHGVTFVSSQECFDTGSPYGEMICKILMVFAEFERASIINRIRDAYEKRSDMGLYPGGKKVYGYDLEEAVISGVKTKRFVPNPEEAAQIRCIYQIYANPTVTLRRLQDNLLEQGITPLSGKDWTTGKLSALMRNPIYVRADEAVYRYFERRNTQIVGELSAFDGTHNIQLYGRSKHDKSLEDWSDMKIVLLESEGIVDADTWLKCQQKLQRNKQAASSTSNRTSWLGGKLICEKCGHTMTTVKGASKRYFLCTGKTHKKTCTGIKETIYVEDMEALLSNCITQKLKGQTASASESHTETEVQLQALKRQLAEIEGQLSRLSEAVLSGNLNEELIAVLNSKAKSLSAEKRGLLDRMDELSVRSPAPLETIDLVRRWRRATFSEKRAICDILVKAVVIAENGDPEIIWNI